MLPTKIVSQEVRREALGAVAHGSVIVCVSSKHQHRPAHNHRCVEVTEEAAVSQNGPAQTHSDGIHLDHMRAPQKSTLSSPIAPGGTSPSMLADGICAKIKSSHTVSLFG